MAKRGREADTDGDLSRNAVNDNDENDDGQNGENRDDENSDASSDEDGSWSESEEDARTEYEAGRVDQKGPIFADDSNGDAQDTDVAFCAGTPSDEAEWRLPFMPKHEGVPFVSTRAGRSIHRMSTSPMSREGKRVPLDDE
jgi:hypothetical protein